MTHLEFTNAASPPTPCRPSHLTPTGKCRNCGYDPADFSAPQPLQGIPAQRLRELLSEAAEPSCPWQRCNAIQIELGRAVCEEGRERWELLVDTLFVDTLRHRPEVLPSLFPAFALLCGPREPGILLGTIEWPAPATAAGGSVMSASHRPSADIRRGLQWIFRAANADFQVASDEEGTGQFTSTNPAEVAEALEWLAAVAFRKGGAA